MPIYHEYLARGLMIAPFVGSSFALLMFSAPTQRTDIFTWIGFALLLCSAPMAFAIAFDIVPDECRHFQRKGFGMHLLLPLITSGAVGYTIGSLVSPAIPRE